jgi:hypothetical protein
LFSCGESTEDIGKLELNFKLQYGGQTLTMFENVNYPDGKSMYFSRFSFYFSNPTLIKSGHNHLLDNLSYLNLTGSHDTKAKAEQGYTITYDNIDVGTYASLDFGIGVPAGDNNKKPSDFPANHILSDFTEYWSGWKSYIFARSEGVIDLDNNGVFGSQDAFSLHLGANEAYRTVSLSNPIEIKKNETTKLTVIIDLKKEFDGNSIYDINSNPQTHSTDQQDQVNELANNLAKAFSIK